MENKYWKITVESNDFFDDTQLCQHIEEKYYYWHSCLYGNMYISNIPNKSTYSIDINNRQIVFENIPTPNTNGYKMFNLMEKSDENLTLFIEVNAILSNNKLEIKLNEELVKIILENKLTTHNMFLLCNTTNGKYFVDVSALDTNKHIPIKKVDSTMSWINSELINGNYNHIQN